MDELKELLKQKREIERKINEIKKEQITSDKGHIGIVQEHFTRHERKEYNLKPEWRLRIKRINDDYINSKPEHNKPHDSISTERWTPVICGENKQWVINKLDDLIVEMIEFRDKLKEEKDGS